MSKPTRDGKPWDGTCPDCHYHVENHVVRTTAPEGYETLTTAWHCPHCGYWWDYRGPAGQGGRMSGPTYRRTWAKWRERNTGNYDEAIRYVQGWPLNRVPENVRRTDEPVAIWETMTHTWADFKAAIERATHG